MSCKKKVSQTWNPINEAWIKFIESTKGITILNEKQKLPSIPFKNIPIKKKPRELSIIDMLLGNNRNIEK